MKQMNRSSFDRRFKLTSIFFWIVFFLILVIMFAGLGFGVWATVEIIDIIRHDGLKSVVDSVWNGQGA